MPWQDGEIHVAALVRSTLCFPRAPLVDEQSATAATPWIAYRCPMCARHPTDCAAYLKLGIYVRPGVSTEPNPWVSRGYNCLRSDSSQRIQAVDSSNYAHGPGVVRCVLVHREGPNQFLTRRGRAPCRL